MKPMRIICRVKANTWKATSGEHLGDRVLDAIEQELAGERSLEDIDSELRKYNPGKHALRKRI